jgi:hypothetical protein
MANYLLAYTGGGMAETDAERDAQMAAWGAWFENIGPSVVDAGNPFGPSRSLSSDGDVSDGGASGLTGYSVVSADSLDAATELAKSCPILNNGGGVQVYETFEVM